MQGRKGLSFAIRPTGNALFDTTRSLVSDRNDMSLSEIDTWLKRSVRK